jgi:hypothetical protein
VNCIPIPKQVKNLTGQHFGRLEVIAYAGNNKRGKGMWVCICAGEDCGRRQVTIPGDNLRSGDTGSCGCLKRERAVENARVLNTRHGLSGHPLYHVWTSMITRCVNPRHKYYANYGGRGIAVCPAWLGSEAGLAQFIADMGPSHEPGLQLDRIDNDGPYSPSNCRWVTKSENNRNTRANRIIEYAGQSRSMADWMEVLGLSRNSIRGRLDRGWTVERALTHGVAPERLAELGLTE